jgi:hypothetical protein
VHPNAFVTAVLAVTLAAASGPVIALRPIELPFEPDEAAAPRALLERELTARLAAAGLTVLAPADVGQVWERRLREAGGFYDPLTGDTLQAKYLAVRDGAFRELRERFGATAWLHARVEVVNASWRGGKAQWDGASEGVAPVGEGRVPALTLAIAVEDSSGALRAAGRGGLQVLAKVKGGRYERVPVDRLFADAKRVAKAVDLALAPLLGERRP